MTQTIDARLWRGDLARRTQYYGYIYDERARSVAPDAYLGPFPPWRADVAAQLHGDGLIVGTRATT